MTKCTTAVLTGKHWISSETVWIRKHLLYKSPFKICVALGSQDLANFCIDSAAVSPLWEPDLISFMAHNKSSHTSFSEI